MDSQSKIEVVRRGAFSVVKLKGRIGLSEAEALAAALEPLVQQNSPCIALDMREVDFIGSRALGALLQVRGEVAKGRGRLVLGAVQPDVAKILRITHLDQILEIADDLEQVLTRSEGFLRDVQRILDRCEKTRKPQGGMTG